MRSETPKLMTNFRVTPSFSSSELYHVARIAPRYTTPATAFGGLLRREPNIRFKRETMIGLLDSFLADTKSIGLDVGQRDPSIKLLAVAGVGLGNTREDPQLHPGYARLRINDGKGNTVQFRMTYEVQNTDDKERDWNKVVVRLEKARIGGKRVQLTPEMKREGFTFLSHNMPEILEHARNGQSALATIRQETPDAACFYDGHHASAGRHELGCLCKEERAKSLDIIHERGGISSLMPGTGNGNGSEAQDIQISVRNSAARRGSSIVPFQEVYPRMGRKGDARNNTLGISTLILEHLFQIRDIPNLTVLSDSKSKKETWNTFGSHIVRGESLNVTPIDSPDSLFKRRRLGYSNTDTNAFPLQPM